MNNMRANAGPTKDFFIEMITRDIQVEKAILDLIDNSIDAAKRDNNFVDKEIELIINQNRFEIKDNCGGFSIETAREYAFKFGRDKNDDNRECVKFSVGRFGVGMKRTLLKLGKDFIIESRTQDEHFKVHVNVEEWSQEPDNWSFDIEKIEYDINGKWQGTHITVTNLYEDIADSFIEKNLVKSTLVEEIGCSYGNLINRGLSIRLNNQQINSQEIKLLNDGDIIRPAIRKLNINGVDIIIIAGIGESSPKNAGWYIYCNDRLVLRANQSRETGWQMKSDDYEIPKFHATYAMFRGIVFMTCDDAKKLPLTTTKVGIDVDSKIYKDILYNMMAMMDEVFNFLRSINEGKVRKEIYDNHNKSNVFEIKHISIKISEQRRVFKCDIDVTGLKDTEERISYKKDKRLVERVRQNLGVSSSSEVGPRTFEYYVEMEEL